MKQFTLIIPVFQTAEILQLFLDSLSETLDYDSQIIFINDGSGAQISGLLQNYNSKVHVKADVSLIEHYESLGCAVSLNEGLKRVRLPCDYIVFLDSDLILREKWQDAVINDFSNSEVGIVGGVLLYPQTGGIQCCGITFQSMTGRHLLLNAVPSVIEAMGNFEIQTTVFAFCAIRYEAFTAVGFLDEGFFNGYEDWDYQFRIREKGYTAITDTTIQHFHWEKSNGAHRGYNRKNNLARFWGKHAASVQDDLYCFIKRGIHKYFTLKDLTYAVIDLCEFKACADAIKNSLRGDISIKGGQILSGLCGNRQTIWLPEVMNSQSFLNPDPYLFLCDHYIRLLDNQYWWSLRQRYCIGDMIIDTYGNVLPFQALKNSFWPGTKIR